MSVNNCNQCSGVCAECFHDFDNHGPICGCIKIKHDERDSVRSQDRKWLRLSKEKKPRPLIIRGIERQRIASDTGVGDTVERIISKFGGDQFKWVMARLGVNCGCEDRKQYLNRVYPY